jgi:hypothetical protein
MLRAKEATGSVEQAIDVIRRAGDDLAVIPADSLTFAYGTRRQRCHLHRRQYRAQGTSQLTDAAERNWESGRKLQLK